MPARWTTAELPDLTGQTVIVTGANSGIGFEATRAFARHGATVVMACRSEQRGEQARRQIRSRDNPAGELDVRVLDLADRASITAFVEGFRADYDDLHVLANNAGVMAIPRQETADGFEMQFGVNHLGHFALTGQLLDVLAATDGETRVVTQSSRAHEGGTIDFEDLQHEHSYGKWEAYGQSKLANLLFAYELDRRLDADMGVTSVACHPGYADTELQARGPQQEGSKVKLWAMQAANALLAQSAERGALPLLYAATVPHLDGGEYVGPGGLLNMRGYPTEQESTNRSRDPDLAARLWTISEECTGVTYGLERDDAGGESTVARSVD